MLDKHLVFLMIVSSLVLGGCHSNRPFRWNCVPDAQYQQAEAALREADLLIAAGNYRKASNTLTVVLRALKYRYVPQVLDDTGMNLGLADWLEKSGKLREGSEIKKEILESRIHVSKTPSSSGCKL